MRIAVVFLVLVSLSTPSYAYIWALLGRSAVSRSVVGNVARSTNSISTVGRVARAGKPSGDFSWVEREIAKAVIKRAIGSTGSDQPSELQEAECLIIDFDGTRNYVANYCGVGVEIKEFAQQVENTNEVVVVACVPHCVIPAETVLQFPPLAARGPFLSANFRQASLAYDQRTDTGIKEMYVPQERTVRVGPRQTYSQPPGYCFRSPNPCVDEGGYGPTMTFSSGKWSTYASACGLGASQKFQQEERPVTFHNGTGQAVQISLYRCD
jgi:hypothetical protein